MKLAEFTQPNPQNNSPVGGKKLKPVKPKEVVAADKIKELKDK